MKVGAVPVFVLDMPGQIDLVGKTLGRHELLRAVSPGKTWEVSRATHSTAREQCGCGALDEHAEPNDVMTLAD